MKRRAVITAGVAFICLLATMRRARAGPFVDFFKSIKHALTQPASRPSSHGTVHKHSTAEKSGKATAKGSVEQPPNEHNTRTAKRVVDGTNAKADLQYGTPVPGKQGFVTSPYAPDSGYIDVRGMAPGTEVKDPYTGKSFLTP